MNFTTTQAVEQVVWQMKLSDYPRGLNRAKINSLFDGAPPFSDSEVIADNIATNVNFLDPTRIAHDARRQFGTAFLNPDPLFTVNIDHGPVWKRREWSQKITSNINRIIKSSLPYMETRRSVFALNVLHGIGPSSWSDKYSWCPDADGIEDILVPSNTLLTLSNLPFFCKFRQYTGQQLWEMTHGPQVDKAWNIPMVEAAVKWVDSQAQALMANNWPMVWSPEKMEDRIKQDSGLYASDAIATIDCWDFYFWRDDGKKSGWRRRIILDAWGQPGVGGIAYKDTSPTKVPGKYGITDTSGFLYDSGDRVYADDLKKVIHFQFADGSSVAPFKYHSVRSLGFLLYSVCHLQNRLRCKFNDAVFESLMQYFRVNNMNDAERALKVDLTDKRPLPDGLQFVKTEERWKIDQALVEMCMAVNRQTMNDNSVSFTQDYDFESDKGETATRTMAKVNSSAALVSAMLTQAYNYQKFQYDEIGRRFCIKNSKDGDARKFRLQCLRDGIPEEALNVEAWDIQPVRVIGSGNKMLQSAMMDKIMLVYYSKLDPTAQREFLRMGLAITTDDYDLARRSVPEQPHVSDSIHDAQLSAGVLLTGQPMDLREGVNHSEYIQELLKAMAFKVQQITQRVGVATPEELMGLQNLAAETIDGQKIPGNGIANHIQIFAQELDQPNQKGVPDTSTTKMLVKQYTDALGKLMNEVKAFAQRLQEQMQEQQAQQQAGGGIDPATVAKVQATTLMAQTKADIAAKNNALKTAQKQVSFEQKLQQDAERHQAELHKSAKEEAHNIALQKLKADMEPTKLPTE